MHTLLRVRVVRMAVVIFPEPYLQKVLQHNFSEISCFILKTHMIFCILPHNEFVFQDKSTSCFLINSIMQNLILRERISDLWKVTYPKSRAYIKLELRILILNPMTIQMHKGRLQIDRQFHGCQLAQQMNRNKSCLYGL